MYTICIYIHVCIHTHIHTYIGGRKALQECKVIIVYQQESKVCKLTKMGRQVVIGNNRGE